MNTSTNIHGASLVHAIFKMNSISASVLLVVLVICIATISTAITLLKKDVTILWMKIYGMVTLRNVFLDMPIQVILLLFARFAKFLLHVVQFILLWCIKWQVTLPHCEFIYILGLTITMWHAMVVHSHTFCGINLCMRLLGEHPNQLPCQQALIS